MDQRWWEVRKKVKRLFNPCKCPLEWQASAWGDVLVSLPHSASQVGGAGYLPELQERMLPPALLVPIQKVSYQGPKLWN